MQEAIDAYEAANQCDTGLLRTGLFGADVEAALSDERTICAAGTSVPIAVPIEHYSVFRPEYFTERIQVDLSNVYGYAGSVALSKVLGIDPLYMTEAMIDELATRQAALVYEQSEERDVRSTLKHALSVRPRPHTLRFFSDLTDDGTGLILPNHYVYEVGFSSAGTTGTDLYEAYQLKDEKNPITVEPRLDDEAITDSYTDYVAAFSRANYYSPLHETLPADYYKLIMKDERHLKFVLREQGVVVGMSVLSPTSLISWINQTAVEQRYGHKYPNQPILIAPITYARPGSRGGQSMLMMQRMATLFSALGGEHLLLGEAHDLSKWLAGQMSIASSDGLPVSISVVGPVLEQTVEAVLF